MKFMMMIISSCLFFSCSITSVHNISGKSFKESSSDKVKVFAGNIDQSYHVIGPIFADSHTKELEDAKELLKEKAAEVGADAVIKVQAYNFSTFARTGLTGVAVILK